MKHFALFYAPLLVSSFLMIALPLSCQEAIRGDGRPIYLGQKLDTTSALQTIALGSCNRQDQPQVMWQYILQHNPQLWIWLGDNIYGDSEDMAVLAAKYRRQKYAPEYQHFRSQLSIVGTWDDHDFGVNNGGKEYPRKTESKKLMLDFLDVPANAPVRRHEGAYQAYTFGPKGRRVRVILLDTRSFRDPIRLNEQKEMIPDPTGTILGEAQWKWLEQQLQDRTVQLFLIGSGFQILPEDHRFEKWANFPSERRRLLELLVRTQPNRVVLISGDRHLAELSRLELSGLGYPLYELTSSGLTHSYEKANEYNRYRVGPLTGKKNFGLLYVNWSGTVPQVRAEVRGLENALYLKEELKW